MKFAPSSVKRTDAFTLAEVLARPGWAGLFLRVHRSYIVNVGAIARIEAPTKDSWCAVLKDGKRIPVSRSGYQRLREMMR